MKELKVGIKGDGWFWLNEPFIDIFPSGFVITKFKPPLEFWIAKSFGPAYNSEFCERMPKIFYYESAS